MSPRVASRSPASGTFATVRGVSLHTQHAGTLLDHVDLDIRRGELLAVVGVNGAGKSSLLRVLAGVWDATEGTITVDGKDRIEQDMEIRRFTAYLPSEPDLLPISVRENVRFFAEAWGVTEEAYAERQDALLRMFDMKELQDARASALSKGQGKKAALACTLVTGASFYLLDEPFTGGIDPRGHHALEQVVDRLAADRDITVVFATQILEIAEALADRVAIVNGGCLLAVGSVDELREQAGLPSDASLTQVFERLTSRDTEVPLEDYLNAMERQ